MSTTFRYNGPETADTVGAPVRNEGRVHRGDIVARSAGAEGEDLHLRQARSSDVVEPDLNRAGHTDGNVAQGLAWGIALSAPFWAILAALIWF